MTNDEKPEPQELRRSRGIYLLPNLFTTSALFAGFYAIVCAMREQFDAAAIAIFIAMILDGLDGRVARLTNTQSAFGAEYDSLSDIVSFGVAPALVVYSWGLFGLGKFGWIAAFFYTAATALRLARFNSRIALDDKRYFQGLPCPAAAGLIAGMVWIADDFGVPGNKLWMIAAIVTVLIGTLMVSSIRYYSFKDVDLRGHVPFIAVLGLLMFFVLVSLDPPKVLFVVFAGYVLSGPLFALKRKIQHFRKPKLPPT